MTRRIFLPLVLALAFPMAVQAQDCDGQTQPAPEGQGSTGAQQGDPLAPTPSQPPDAAQGPFPFNPWAPVGDGLTAGGLVLPPLEPDFVPIGIRSHGMAADGSCSERAVSVTGSFTSATSPHDSGVSQLDPGSVARAISLFTTGGAWFCLRPPRAGSPLGGTIFLEAFGIYPFESDDEYYFWPNPPIDAYWPTARDSINVRWGEPKDPPPKADVPPKDGDTPKDPPPKTDDPPKDGDVPEGGDGQKDPPPDTGGDGDGDNAGGGGGGGDDIDWAIVMEALATDAAEWKVWAEEEEKEAAEETDPEKKKRAEDKAKASREREARARKAFKQATERWRAQTGEK